MSRSWERKVRKNMAVLSKQKKKQGVKGVTLQADKELRFVGRNFILPIVLLVFIVFYCFIMLGNPALESDTMFWVTAGCYVGLAALFFFRKPYLTIGKDYVQSRRIMGDKRMPVSAIKGIRVQDGSVVIELEKGGNWMFTRMMNRFPTDEMADKLKAFANTHHIKFTEI